MDHYNRELKLTSLNIVATLGGLTSQTLSLFLSLFLSLRSKPRCSSLLFVPSRTLDPSPKLSLFLFLDLDLINQKEQNFQALPRYPLTTTISVMFLSFLDLSITWNQDITLKQILTCLNLKNYSLIASQECLEQCMISKTEV